MNFGLSEEQEEFQSTLRRFFEERCTLLDVRRTCESQYGYDSSLWKQMGEELGLQGVAIDETFGGQGFRAIELALVCEELGRALVPTPFFASVCLASEVLKQVATEEEKRKYLPAIANTEQVATLAFLEDSLRWDSNGVRIEVNVNEDKETAISGKKHHVLNANDASLILVVARLKGTTGNDGVSLFAIETDQPGTSILTRESLDLTRSQAEVQFDAARATPLGKTGEAWPGIQKALLRADINLAAEALGGAQRCLELAVEYAKVRRQFSRPIGSFQAIKHKCAEVLLEIETARSALYYAAWAASENHDELATATHMAKSLCCEAYQRASTENIQIHGGIGFTWENDAHLYFRRARAIEATLASPQAHRSALAEILSI